MKTKIKIGGVACSLEDMPLSFQEAVKRGMKKEKIEKEKIEEEKIEKEKIEEDIKIDRKIDRNIEKVAKVSILRKMFGYKSRSC